MIYKATLNWKSSVGVIVIGAALVGCGQNNNSQTATTTTSTAPTAQTAKDDHTHAPGEAAHSHEGEAGSAAPAELAAFFPGAELTKKPFPLNDELAQHMGKEAGVKFTGKESEWEVYEATQNGTRSGLAVMTHSDLPGGGDMHIAFAVDKAFKVSKAAVSEAPDTAKMKTFITQVIGKTHDSAFKVGKDLKAAPGLSPQVAQIAADAVHKGVVILEENFNPSHSEHEHAAPHGAAGHVEGDGHTH